MPGPDDSHQDLARFSIGKLFWQISEAIVAVDLDTEAIVLWNPAAEELFGYPAREAVGMPLADLVPEDERERHLAGIRRYRDGASPPVLVGTGAVDLPAVTRDGSRLEIRISLTDISESERDRFVLAVIRDVTELRETQRQLVRSNESMRDFVATASHDLRTPLASILGFAGLLRDRGHELSPDLAAEAIDAVVRGAKTAARLVDDLLTLSQIQAGVVKAHVERVAVSEVVAEAAGLAAVAVDTEIDGDLAVSVDRHHLERILVNLISNAASHGAPPINVTATGAGAEVSIGVRDLGAGVATDDEHRLFEPFSQIGGAGPSTGTGLGLSIVRGLAEAAGGRAFYRRGDGESVFGVVLPAAGPEVQPGQLRA